MKINNLGKRNSGNALLYVFISVGLLGALTYAFVKGSKENYSVQNASRVAEEMYVQINLIKSSVLQCQLEYVEGGGDLNGDGTVDASDSPNAAYPLQPSDPLVENQPSGCTKTGDEVGCVTQASDDTVKNLSCVGAPAASAYMFTGANNSGSFMPLPPSGFNEWVYHNDADGVYVQITPKEKNMTYDRTYSRLMDKFVTCQADINYNSCGENCFTAWIKRNSCPDN